MNPAQLIENRSALLIFRDCLKLASRMVDQPVKAAAVRTLIRRQFEKNKQATDPEEIRSLKMTAATAISNYLIYTVKDQYNLKENKTIYEPDEEGEEGLNTQGQPEDNRSS